jgi:hypothetical protein
MDNLTYRECHCEPFAFCHSERSEESLTDPLRINSVKQSFFIGLPRPPHRVRGSRNDDFLPPFTITLLG